MFGVSPQINLDDTLGKLSHILENDHFAIVVHDVEQCKCNVVLIITSGYLPSSL